MRIRTVAKEVEREELIGPTYKDMKKAFDDGEKEVRYTGIDFGIMRHLFFHALSDGHVVETKKWDTNNYAMIIRKD